MSEKKEEPEAKEPLREKVSHAVVRAAMALHTCKGAADC